MITHFSKLLNQQIKLEWVKRTIFKISSEIVASPEDLSAIVEILEKETTNINSDIRHVENSYLIEWISVLLLDLAEQKYGGSSLEAGGISMIPAFFKLSRSQVGVTLATPETPNVMHIICIGTHVRTWQQLFYELAHETLHLLGPTDTSKNPVARIEEGVAVKFAEDFYEIFVFPAISPCTR